MKIVQKITSFSLILAGFYFVFLKVNNALGFYIRPEQEIFTVSMAALLIIAGIVTLLSGGGHSDEVPPAYGLATFLVIAFAIGGIFLPRRSLSAETAGRRGTNQNTGIGLVKTVSKQGGSLNPLLGSIESSSYSVADWFELFQIDPNPESYAGKKVSLEGFIEPTGDGNFNVTRFVLTCCIVDAYPIGIYVDHDYSGYKKNDWVRVKGEFKTKELEGKPTVAVEVSAIEKIPDPNTPYY